MFVPGLCSLKGIHSVFPAWDRPPLIWKRSVLPARWWYIEYKNVLLVLECLKDRAFHIRTVYVNCACPNGLVWRLGNPQFRKWSVGLFTNVCVGCINYLKLWCFLNYPLTVWSHIFTGCSQGGKLTFRNIVCTFKEFCWLQRLEGFVVGRTL